MRGEGKLRAASDREETESKKWVPTKSFSYFVRVRTVKAKANFSPGTCTCPFPQHAIGPVAFVRP
ncbi:hypothetical protein NC651_020224 [Populus alba x Populus x berolinensis]|uniref:Uncharacterized protein n=1 Tax=Populus alba x Populus x berolinensis TaxID=444605 RepID=A0AAD6MLD8_9ROSI|nr:hypothetical protein NC651_020224 [Populus alba x Populus x berolinensis]KAJ6987688.1 hypothetical protein NC653_020824 [Populus alba x Populus x berolinensis]